MSSDRDELSSTDIDFPVDFAKLLHLHHADLRDTLNVPALMPLMGKYNLLTGEERQEIQCKATDSEKIDHLVHILPRKGKCGYQTFIRCLESEKEHLGHPDLVLKFRKTVKCLKTQHLQPFQSTDRVSKTATGHGPQESDAFPHFRQLMVLFKERDDTIKDLKEKIASLEIHLQQKDKLISDLQSRSSHTQFHAVSESAKFQQLVHYVNGGHASQLCDTPTIAKHYRELHPIMKDAKRYLKQHTEYVKYCIHSEESDGIRSRTSSELSSECVKAEESAKDSDSYTSADETDDIDEGSDTNLEPEDQHNIVRRLKSQQRPESWIIAQRERRATKVLSRFSISSAAHSRKGSTSDSDANDDKQLLEGLGIVDTAAAASGAEEHQHEDIHLACSNVGLSSIGMTSCSLLEGYLHKGTGTHEIWKKRYFILTTQVLYYSKSQQASRSGSMNGFPLIGLALERKKKSRTFEVINIQATNIKVDKPGRRHVSIANCKVIKLKASSETKALKWIESIEDAITKLKSQYFTST